MEEQAKPRRKDRRETVEVKIQRVVMKTDRNHEIPRTITNNNSERNEMSEPTATKTHDKETPPIRKVAHKKQPPYPANMAGSRNNNKKKKNATGKEMKTGRKEAKKVVNSDSTNESDEDADTGADATEVSDTATPAKEGHSITDELADTPEGAIATIPTVPKTVASKGEIAIITNKIWSPNETIQVESGDFWEIPIGKETMCDVFHPETNGNGGSIESCPCFPSSSENRCPGFGRNPKITLYVASRSLMKCVFLFIR